MSAFDVNLWREHVLAWLDAAQRLWLALLAALGGVDSVDGQPAWPHAHRFAAQVLAYDDGLLKQLLWSGAAVLVALGATAWAGWRVHRRWGAWHRHPQADQSPAWALRAAWPLGLAALALWGAPWPAAHLVLLPATLTSFHASPTGFSAHSIVQGQRLYLQHCASCHGDTGRADGPRAGEGEVWPPMLAGGLLAKRLEGELLWRVRHGWATGEKTTPHQFVEVLSTEQTWQVLDFLAANVAGQNLVETGEWPQPVKLPAAAWRCGLPQSASPQALPAQRLRVVLGGGVQQRIARVSSNSRNKYGGNEGILVEEKQNPTAAWGLPADLQPDPRLVTVLALPQEGAAPAHEAIDCATHSSEFRQAMAVVLGVPRGELAGHQLLVDAQGWLRARSTPDAPGWREDDLVCKPAGGQPGAPLASAQGRAGAALKGLDALIARMDAAPLAPVRAGFVHR